MSHVLVVDDEEDVRAAVKRRLEREGFQVSVAASAKEAAEIIDSQGPSFDVVVTDMSMEEEDSGLKVLRAAVSNDLFTEVIVLTAYGNVANAVQSMQFGAFDYIEKNMPRVQIYEVLATKVNAAMNRRSNSVSTIRRLEQFVSLVKK